MAIGCHWQSVESGFCKRFHTLITQQVYIYSTATLTNMKPYTIIGILLLANMETFAQDHAAKSNGSSFDGLLVTTTIALIGYLGKSFYDLYLDNRKKRIQNIEDKLKLFFWPVLIRLEKDNAIWETILSKRQDTNSIQYKIANQVEKNSILKNHQEVLGIIDSYAYLAEPDTLLTEEIKKYIKNVTIYKALRESGEETMFPLALGAAWPEHFYSIIKSKTEYYQAKLNSKPI